MNVSGLKTLMVVDNEFVGDPRVFNEATILSKEGVKVDVLCFSFGRLPLYEEVNGLKVYRTKIRRSLKNYLFSAMTTIPLYHYYWSRIIEKQIEISKPDVLHVHDLYMAKSAHLATRRQKIPIILDLHENFPAVILTYNWANKFPKRLIVKPKRWRELEETFLLYADKIVVLSSGYRDDLIRKFKSLDQSRFCIYPNVPDIHTLLSYPVDTHILDDFDGTTLFYFGVIAERRGIFTTIKALQALLKKNYKVRLLLIGPVDKVDQQLFYSAIGQPDVKDFIVYYPWKDISALPSYVLKSTICLSPIVKNEQHESGIANKVFQYLLFKRPVVVSDCKPQLETINRYKCGLVFESENSDDLALKIEQLIVNPSLREEMGENGRKAVNEHFNIERFKENLIDLYRSI